MTGTVCLPLGEVIEFHPMASVALCVWWCRICGLERRAVTSDAATADALTHLAAHHHGREATTDATTP